MITNLIPFFLLLMFAAIVLSIFESMRRARNVRSLSPLAKAVAAGDMPTVTNLLDSGADVNEKSNLGDTALLVAASANKPEMVKLLVENGAEVDHLGSDERTALRFSVEANNEETVKYLISKGADVNLSSPLLNASHQGNVEIMKLLLSNNADPKGQSIISAVKESQIEAVKCLIDAGADVNQNVGLMCAVNENMPPLITAISKKNVEIVKMLLDNGADSNGKCFYLNAGQQVTETPMYMAKWSLNKEIKEMIKQAGGK